MRLPLKYELFNSINRLKATHSNSNWSIAVLVKSRQDTLSISSYLLAEKINHEVVIDPAGPTLAGVIIAQLMEPFAGTANDEKRIIHSITNHIRGRKGEKISKKDIELAKFLEEYLIANRVTGSNRKLLIEELKDLIKKRVNAGFLGVPEEDWLRVRQLFQVSKHEVLKNVFEDAKYLRLLNKGAILSEKLSEMWRNFGEYKKASEAVEEAFTQEHFSMTNRTYNGIIVMNIHKSKGKEFDEVIIWEDLHRPIVFPNSTASRLIQDRLVLRVAVTRAKSKTTFMTPKSSPCLLM
jgi:DNA helicase-2/ATP-dependent DNA helicase PcrA